MITTLAPISEEVYFCQQFDIKGGDFCFLSELFQDLRSVLSIAKISNQARIQNLIGCIRNHLSVNIVSFNLNVDWKLNDCFHNFSKFKLLLLPFVLKDSSGVENNHPRLPVCFTWVKEVYNMSIFSLCSPFSRNRFQTEN